MRIESSNSASTSGAYSPVAGRAGKEGRPPHAPVRGGGPWWWGEVAAAVAAVSCMAAMVYILAAMQGHRLAEWTLFISLSAAVAVLMTAAKSLCAFFVASAVSQSKWLHFASAPRPLGDLDLLDDASRGPLGSARLLLTSRWRVASVGALITVLALGSDAFVQQIVKFEPRDVLVEDGGARFGLSHNYSVGGLFTAGGYDTPVYFSADNIAMQGAIFRGVYNISSLAVFDCASRCTWPEPTYVSLGFSAACQNVTRDTLAAANASLWEGYNHGGDLLTPGGVNLSARYSPTSSQVVVSVGSRSLLFFLEGGLDFTDKDGAPPALARVAVLRVPPDRVNSYIHLSQVEVVECDIGLAAYEYSNVSASGNQFTVGAVTVTPLTVRSSVTDNVWLKDGSRVATYRQPGLPVFTASLADIVAVHETFLSPRFVGNIYGGESGSPAQGIGDAFRYGDMIKTFENMATCMTDQMRSGYQVVAAGLTHRSEVYVRVRWEWLPLPLLVVAASVVFFVIVVARCARSGVRVGLWKDSTLAVLFHRVLLLPGGGDGVGAPGVLWTEAESPRHLEEMGKRNWVQLRQ